MTSFSTGSLVRWRQGSIEGDVYGIVVDFERKKASWAYSKADGAWLHFPNQPGLVWSALSSLEVLVQTGSYM